MPSTTRTTDSALASALRISVMRLARRLRQERSDTALTISQLAALSTLERHGPLTPGELAAHEKVQPPSMTRIVSTLEGLGLVSRAAHPSDGRQVLVRASDAGVRLLADDRRRREAWLACRLQELSAEERRLLEAAAPVLDKLASA